MTSPASKSPTQWAWRHRALSFGVMLSFGGALVGCSREKEPRAREAAAEGPSQPKSPPASAAEPAGGSAPPAVEPIAHVPIGEFTSGSRPGTAGRDPAFEPIERRRSLGPFRIDALPYPGDPKAEPRRGVSVDEATALCAERGGRLCTELEWERACRGPESSTFPGGERECASGYCKSTFDVVFASGLSEHTRSVFGKGSELEGQPVVRGGTTEATAGSNTRCGRRGPAPKDPKDAGFRCCYGAPNAERVEEPALGTAYEEVDIDEKELRRLLASDPMTAGLAASAKFYSESAAGTVLSRGPGEDKGFTLTTRAVRWRPARGVELLVVSGMAEKKQAFVVAYFAGGAQEKLAGSFWMKNEPGPIVLAYAESIRPRMHFSGCWGCPGETGKLLFRPPEEVVLLQP